MSGFYEEVVVTLAALRDRFSISQSTLARLLEREGIQVVPADDGSTQQGILASDVRRVREARQKALKGSGGRQFYLPPE